MLPTEIRQAASEIVQMLVAAYRTQRGVHSETVIGAAAALAGEIALRVSEAQLPDSGWVLSQRASALLSEDTAERPSMAAIVLQGALAARGKQEDLPDVREAAQRIANAVGGSPFPPLSVPQGHFPHEWSPNACPRYRDRLDELFDKHGLEGDQRAIAAALAVAMLITQTKDVLAPETAATLALEIMLGVARMRPLSEPIV